MKKFMGVNALQYLWEKIKEKILTMDDLEDVEGEYYEN